MSPALFRRRRPLPDALRSALDPDERINVTAPCDDGRLLAVSRFGLWVVPGPDAGSGSAGSAGAGADGAAGPVHRIGWELVARARLTARVLAVIPTRVVGSLPDGDGADGAVDVLVDEPELVFGLATRSGLTDVVHQRVRRSVAASRHLPHPGAGGWVVLRRVPGRDGLTRQVRLDPGADPFAPGFAAAVVAVAAELAATMPA
ncbi:hypothetical protein [Nakamurella sp.]|uniref:hypothetical protein n=1 Tax=Nakamurella sp. TaxID=1869182 RepID=UPI003B3BDE93